MSSAVLALPSPRAHARADRAAVAGFLEVLRAVGGLHRRHGVEIGEDRGAVVLAGADGEHPARGELDREAHDDLVDRADLLDVEGAVGEPLAGPGRGLLDGHEAFEDAPEAAVGEAHDPGRLGEVAAALEEGEDVGVEELAAPGGDEAAPVALEDQAEEREEPAPTAVPLVHGVGVQGRVLDQAAVEPAHRVVLVVEVLGALVGRGGQELAILGVKEKHQAHQDGEQALVEMLRAVSGEVLDQRRLGRGHAAEQLVQGPQHLLGEAGRDGGLGVAAPGADGPKAPVGRLVEEPEAVEEELQARQHRPAGGGGERAEREGEPARGLALGRKGEAELPVGEHDADHDAALAQEALEALVRRRLPALGRAALVGVGAGGQELDQELERPIGLEAADGPVGGEQRLVLGDEDGKVLWQWRAARGACHVGGIPAQDLLEEGPGISDGRAVAFEVEMHLQLGRVGLGLLLGDERQLLDHRWRDDEARGLDVIQPFEIGVAAELHVHGAQPVTGQR